MKLCVTILRYSIVRVFAGSGFSAGTRPHVNFSLSLVESFRILYDFYSLISAIHGFTDVDTIFKACKETVKVKGHRCKL